MSPLNIENSPRRHWVAFTVNLVMLTKTLRQPELSRGSVKTLQPPF